MFFMHIKQRCFKTRLIYQKNLHAGVIYKVARRICMCKHIRDMKTSEHLPPISTNPAETDKGVS